MRDDAIPDARAVARVGRGKDHHIGDPILHCPGDLIDRPVGPVADEVPRLVDEVHYLCVYEAALNK